MRSLALIGCTLLTVGALSQDYTVERSFYSVEYRNHVDSALMRESANLLLSGPANEKELIRRAKHEAGEKRRAALAVMLYSGDPKYLPVLLSAAADPKLYAFASEAVTINPEPAWPLLWRLVRAGNSGLVPELLRYKGMRIETLDELVKSRFPKVREVAIRNAYWSTRHAFDALSDPNWGVCRAAVRVLLRAKGFDKSKLHFHEIDRVRVFAAELSQRNTVIDQWMWAKIARDPHPDVRLWAMYMLGSSLGHDKNGGKKECILAVGAALVRGPARVREAAVHAVRGWLFRWEDRRDYLSPEEIAEIRQILESQVFRAELFRQLPEKDLGYPQGKYSVTMAEVGEALAIAGDPRALSVLSKSAHGNSMDRIIRAYAYLDPQIASRELRAMIVAAAWSGKPNNARGIFFQTLQTRALVDWPLNAKELIAITEEPAISLEIRRDLVRALPYANNRELNDHVLQLARALDRNAIFGLLGMADPRAEALLIKLSNNEDPNLSRTARNFLNSWRETHRPGEGG